jgi:Ala-tRNA(Pro) deacylase
MQLTLELGKMNNDDIVMDLLKIFQVPFERYDHLPVYTVEDAQKVEGNRQETKVKNLFLRNRKGNRHYLLIALETQAIDLGELAKLIGESALGLASPQRLKEYLGVLPGAVGPFGLVNDVNHAVAVLLDERLRTAKQLGFHPNINTATLVISGADLVKLVAQLGNPLKWIDFGQLQESGLSQIIV